MKKVLNSITHALLDQLAEAGPLMIDAFFPKYYPGTGLIRGLFGLDHIRYSSAKEAKHSFSSILNRLKRERLVVCMGPKKKSKWRITKKGLHRLKEIKSERPKIVHVLPPTDDVTRLVTFDVPETEKGNRLWLRKELLACGFESLQKSVYIGNHPLPESFIRLVDARSMSKYIHIVSLTTRGTISNKL